MINNRQLVRCYDRILTSMYLVCSNYLPEIVFTETETVSDRAKKVTLLAMSDMFNIPIDEIKKRILTRYDKV